MKDAEAAAVACLSNLKGVRYAALLVPTLTVPGAETGVFFASNISRENVVRLLRTLLEQLEAS